MPVSKNKEDVLSIKVDIEPKAMSHNEVSMRAKQQVESACFFQNYTAQHVTSMNLIISTWYNCLHDMMKHHLPIWVRCLFSIYIYEKKYTKKTCIIE